MVNSSEASLTLRGACMNWTRQYRFLDSGRVSSNVHLSLCWRRKNILQSSYFFLLESYIYISCYTVSNVTASEVQRQIYEVIRIIFRSTDVGVRATHPLCTWYQNNQWARAREWAETQDCTLPIILARVEVTDVSHYKNIMKAKAIIHTISHTHTHNTHTIHNTQTDTTHNTHTHRVISRLW